MSIKPILFNTDMVKAILDGRKTVTRRVVKLPKYVEKQENGLYTLYADGGNYKDQEIQQILDYLIPPYQPEDTIYIRETWNQNPLNEYGNEPEKYIYKASYDGHVGAVGWHPSIHMPKEAARIWLKVTNVRVERLQDMNVDDVIKEGVFNDDDWKYQGSMRAKLAFELWEDTWNSTIKKSEIDSYGQDANPWVWAISFERCKKPQEVNH